MNAPMFPLGGVLFPYAVVPLHVFEERYRVMVRACLAGERRFGVVLIERGPEVGGGDVRTNVGTMAEIVDAVEGDDGRWAIVAVGTGQRLRVQRWLADDPYPRADVEPLNDNAPWTEAADDAYAHAERAVRRSLDLRQVPQDRVELDTEPAKAQWQLAHLSPLGPFDRQRVLAHDDPAGRLHLLASLVEEANEMLAHRPGGG